MPTCGWCRSCSRSSFSRSASRRRRASRWRAGWRRRGRRSCWSGWPATTASMAIAGNAPGRQLTALDYVPMAIARRGAGVGRVRAMGARRIRPSGRDRDRPARSLHQRPMADGRIEPADGSLSRGGLVPARPVADRARSRLPRTKAGGPSGAQQSAARRVRLSVADRHAPDPRASGSTGWEPVWAGEARSCSTRRRSARTAKHRDQRHPERHRHPADKLALQAEDGVERLVDRRPERHGVVAVVLAGQLADAAGPRRSAGTAGC